MDGLVECTRLGSGTGVSADMKCSGGGKGLRKVGPRGVGRRCLTEDRLRSWCILRAELRLDINDVGSAALQ
ncbi:hypothetical protein P7K49_039148 [Saguinus oedipus]|uniref:Uncharacterized protein n=1 Tax=Saguinus oedipus TaxID=9490 RepID=A0ABQ9TGN2_SAGOE|nr:hypothetical protein P7K49_039148 [Saguinus oedipus]